MDRVVVLWASGEPVVGYQRVVRFVEVQARVVVGEGVVHDQAVRGECENHRHAAVGELLIGHGDLAGLDDDDLAGTCRNIVAHAVLEIVQRCSVDRVGGVDIV